MNIGCISYGKDLKGRQANLCHQLDIHLHKWLDICITHAVANAKFLLAFDKHRTYLLHLVDENVDKSGSAYIVQVMIDVILGGNFICLIITKYPLFQHLPVWIRFSTYGYRLLI